jgi:hypothetical protein
MDPDPGCPKTYGAGSPTLITSVVDRHRFDADPNPNFLFNAEPDTDPERHKNNANPYADPTNRMYTYWNLKEKKWQKFLKIFKIQRWLRAEKGPFILQRYYYPVPGFRPFIF